MFRAQLVTIKCKKNKSGKLNTLLVKNPAVNEELEASGEDPNLKELIQRQIRTYYRGHAEKKAHLIGADPGE